MPGDLTSAIAGPTREDLDRFRRGDPEVAELLARRACRLALRTSAAILRDREAATDVAQDVAVDVLRTLDRLRDPAAFDAWVHRITVRHTMRLVGRRSRARNAEQPLAQLGEGDHPPAAERETQLFTRQALAGALAELPPKQQIALALRYVHDLPDAEIAAALGCRTGTVHALLSRGRAALRRAPQLAEFAPEVALGGLR
ncbi:MAG: polymerase sigma-70 factor, subfamily [Solirubrobacteraceae bacterium]|nr:polymerase sigma-70 factor, subfamily [Solirubrobacteraceae bacterium]